MKKKAPQLGKPQMSRAVAAMRLRTIRDQNVNVHKTAQDQLKLADSIEQKNARTSQQLEYNRLLGASSFGRLTPFAIGRLEDLKKVLNKG